MIKWTTFLILRNATIGIRYFDANILVALLKVNKDNPNTCP
jgi:hypothetical protein